MIAAMVIMGLLSIGTSIGMSVANNKMATDARKKAQLQNEKLQAKQIYGNFWSTIKQYASGTIARATLSTMENKLDWVNNNGGEGAKYKIAREAASRTAQARLDQFYGNPENINR